MRVRARICRGQLRRLDFSAHLLDMDIRPERPLGKFNAQSPFNDLASTERVSGDLGRKCLARPGASFIRREIRAEFCFVLHVRADQ